MATNAELFGVGGPLQRAVLETRKRLGQTMQTPHVSTYVRRGKVGVAVITYTGRKTKVENLMEGTEAEAIAFLNAMKKEG
jgi:hypothetical protein